MADEMSLQEIATRLDDLMAVVRSQGQEFTRRLDGIDGRLDGIDGRLDGIDQRLDGLDERLNGVDRRLDGIDGRLDGIDGRLNGVDQRLDGLDDRLDDVVSRLDRIDVRMDRMDLRLDRIETKTDAALEGLSIMNDSMDRQFAAVLAKLDERAAPLEAAQRSTTSRVRRLEARRKRR